MIKISLLLLALVTEVWCQQPDWLVRIVPVSTNIGTSNQTSVDQSQAGDNYVTLSSGLPSTTTQLFGTTVSSSSQLLNNNMKFYTKNGDFRFSYTAQIYEPLPAFLKTSGSDVYLLSCSIYEPSSSAMKLMIQKLAVAGEAYTVSGAPIIVNTNGVSRLADRPTTIWFWGGSHDRLYRFSVVDGTSAQSAVIGDSNLTIEPRLVVDLPNINMLLVMFGSNERLASINRATLGTVQTQTVTGDDVNQVTPDKTTESIWWVLQKFGSTFPYDNRLQRRQISTTGGTLMTNHSTGSFVFDFLDGKISQFGTFGVLLVAPLHTAFETSPSLNGLCYFAKKQDLSVIAVQQVSGFRWNFKASGSELVNDLAEDSGKRFYLGLIDTSNLNFWTGYFLIDTCMSPADSSLTCTTCPLGYWRLGPSFTGVRKCLLPSQFPALSGMNNTTMTCDPCPSLGCLDCIFDHMECVRCNNSAGYFLNKQVSPARCQKVEEMPTGQGLDSSAALVVNCRDTNCLNCSQDFRACLRCNTMNGWYLQGGFCVQESLVPSRFGLNLLTGQVTTCAVVGCLGCKSDHKSCKICDSKAGWYLDPTTNLCVSAITLPPGMGPDRFALVIKSCREAECAECRTDWKVCSRCSSGRAPQNGRCTNQSSQSTAVAPQPSRPIFGSLSPGATRFYVENSTAIFRFSEPILLVYQGLFTDAFNITLTDTLTGKSLSCEDNLSTKTKLRCSAAVFGSILLIKLQTDTELFIGRLSLSLARPVLSQRNLQSIAGLAFDQGIVEASSGAIFVSYPLTVDGVSTQSDPYLFWAAQPFVVGKHVRPIASVLLAAISLSLSILLDKQLANLEYLAVLEGPILVYPQQVFDLVEVASIFWPTELFGAPDWFSEVSRASSCRPTAAFERQGYQCGLLSSLGIDLYAGVITAFICLVLSVISNKMIDSRSEAIANCRLRNIGSGESKHLLEPATKKVTPLVVKPRINQVASKFKMAFPLRRTASAKPVAQTSPPSAPSNQSSSLAENLLLKRLRCLPIGAVKGDLSQDKPALRWAWWRNRYGLTFLLARIEANQLKIVFFLGLNFWTASYGSFEQYSLIAAIIFTLYYIFQGYFTYQFASYIWKEVQRQDRESQSAQVCSDPESNKTNPKMETSTQSLRKMLPELLSGPNRDPRSVLFEEFGVPTQFRHVLLPVVWQARCGVLALIVVGLAKHATAQVILALIVEIAYLVFIITSHKPRKLSDRLIEAVSQILICVYLSLKLLTLTVNMSEKLRQLEFGYVMAWVLICYGTIGVVWILWRAVKLIFVHVKNGLFVPSRPKLDDKSSPSSVDA